MNTCPGCGQQFASAIGLGMHWSYKHGVLKGRVGRPKKCKTCGETMIRGRESFHECKKVEIVITE